MTQQTDMVPAAPMPGPADVKPGDVSLVELQPISISTTVIEGAPLNQRGAFDAFQRPPVAGMLSVIFAIVAFYHATLLLAPLAVLCGVIALLCRQYNWALIGIIAGLVALASDVTFWAMLGITWTMHWLLWS
jgi:hypothetical protein